VANSISDTAILLGGGIDSSVLLCERIKSGVVVHPLFVRCGLRWEADELAAIRRLLAAVAAPNLRPLTVLEEPAADLYGRHWSISGDGIPDEATSDEAVYLPGRNLLLLSKSMLWCHLNRVPTVALAVLRGNPFPDATPQFIAALEAVVNQAVGGKVRVECPYATLTKRDVMARADGFPLELTFSCLRAVEGCHCGHCNKCAERQKAFAAVGRRDLTEYARAR
jgi:7-cyano-7-deazaguanine synthase